LILTFSFCEDEHSVSVSFEEYVKQILREDLFEEKFNKLGTNQEGWTVNQSSPLPSSRLFKHTPCILPSMGEVIKTLLFLFLFLKKN